MSNIMWTPKQQEIAAMLREGKPQKEIMAAGHGKAAISKVRTALKAEEKAKAKEIKETQGTPGPVRTLETQKYKPRTLETIEIGTIVIEPADWRINQFGALLILTTYENAKQQFGYEGTVGEFICDAVQVLRTIMGLQIMDFEYLIEKEDGNGRLEQEETSQGASVSAKSGTEPVGEPEPGTVG
jgi:hypothetical protein